MVNQMRAGRFQRHCAPRLSRLKLQGRGITSGGVALTTGAATGIVADDGGRWPGTTDLPLRFP